MLTFSGELTHGHQFKTFEVSTGTQRLCLSGTTLKPGFLYVYLYDARQQLRASILLQKPEKTVVIGHKNASLGGIAGEIPPGRWTVHIYNLEGEDRNHNPMLYRIEVTTEHLAGDELDRILIPTVPNLNADNEIIFDYRAIKNPASGWYRGDMHAHTVLSDGHNTLEAAVAIIKRQQLDFIFLTEHNICHPALPDCADTLVLPGIEITTDKGHFNVHGPQKGLAMCDADCSSEALIHQGLAIANSTQQPGTMQNAVNGNISINHPMMKPWHWQYASMPLSHVHTMEICCDPTWSTSPAATESALNVLSTLWNNGQRIYAVGGSDSHLTPQERNPQATEPSIYGDPATFVFSHGLCGEGILTGLRQGHVYIERRCGLMVNINQGHVLPGQDVGDREVNIHVAVTDRTALYYAECVADGKVISCGQIMTEGIDFKTDMRHYAWVRIDIRRGDLPHAPGQVGGEFEAMVNPVFNGQRGHFAQPKINTWGELQAAMNRNGH
ncbi:CehA/McbA family metallohydrolase [Acerihabitans sp. TG2]|uniref:CehA/McbA family metallohydrolase n=1 Tax=Acerihabitans sp. TG2 TaxID=3096008 RepID=UPI002B239F65|nr:CehA/McbA family metallohydrolase [Acerihabitans sp. TG2]MEA9392071.1 CehA/McbA family metallohydrolase [Acerihabitans sp. TG2]